MCEGWSFPTRTTETNVVQTGESLIDFGAEEIRAAIHYEERPLSNLNPAQSLVLFVCSPRSDHRPGADVFP